MRRGSGKTYTGRHEPATPPAQLPCGSQNRLHDSGKDLHAAARTSKALYSRRRSEAAPENLRVLVRLVGPPQWWSDRHIPDR